MPTVQDQTQGCSSFKRREKVNPATKSKKRKNLPLDQTGKSRARVNIGMAFNRWRALKTANGLKSDAEVAAYLLDVMKQLPPTSASTGADGQKMQFSQAEVQTLIREEVCSALQKNEARLQTLMESVQQLDNGLDYEKSISKLEARVNRVAKKAEAALAYVMKGPPPPIVKDVICISEDSDDQTVETTSQIEKSPVTAKTGGAIEIMKNPKKARKSMHGLTEALTYTIEDLGKKQPPPVSMPQSPLEFKTYIKKELRETACNEALAPADLQEERHSPGLTPKFSPEFKGLGRVVKKEPEDPQEREHNNEELERFEEPEAKKVKAECAYPSSSNNPWDTDRDTIQRGLVFPPLPATTFPSILSMEAASYSIPQKLEVQLALIKNPTSLSVLWKVAEEVPSPPPMDTYTIFMTMEKIKGSGIFPEWKILGEVKAVELPMCVLIKKHKPGHKVCAAVVGKDVFGRYGPYSTVATAAIPD